MIDADKAGLLDRFSETFNHNDIEGPRTCVTDDFRWIFYAGPNRPDGLIFNGIAEACQAVADRAQWQSSPIEFSDAERYQCGDKVFITYRARGVFKDTGAFDVRAVDIYSFRQGLLETKDTYWKIITGSSEQPQI